MNSNADLTRAFESFRRRDLGAAEALCRRVLAATPRSVDALHLLALVLKDAARLEDAEKLFLECIALAPQAADIRANLGNLYRNRGSLQDAERRYREALTIDSHHVAARLALARTLSDQGNSKAAETEARLLTRHAPGNPQAWLLLAMTLREQQRLPEAESALRSALRADPQHGPALHNLGALLATLERTEESLAALQAAQARGVGGFELEFNLGRALLQLYRIEEAEQAFARAVALAPDHIEAQGNLARIRFMRGDAAFTRDIEATLATRARDVPLQLLLALMLRRAGDTARAEDVLRKEVLRNPQSVEAQWALAETLLEDQRPAEAEPFARQAIALQPSDIRARETLVTILLARAEPQPALEIIRRSRADHPLDQRWIAYEAIAARMLGDPLYERLYEYARFVRVYDLAPPPGWSSLEELNAALMATLTPKHRWAAHPLDQSLRHGSQTTRNLLRDPTPALQAAFKMFAGAVEDYQRMLGSDPSHPLTARNKGPAELVAAWSVLLHRHGFHVNHVHPVGWISSAYYVAVPDEVNDAGNKPGWLKFGEPRFPTPGLSADYWVEPRAGRLVLFPSYMWHGTTAIQGNITRTTIAFDAAPKSKQVIERV